VHWIWDPDKAKGNRRKHGLSFETAIRVFDDPLHASQADPHPEGDRWQTVGRVGTVTLIVVHTFPSIEHESVEPVGRIISARKATAHERKKYEEGDL
jgi:uncharacterized DUF497 family protein